MGLEEIKKKQMKRYFIITTAAVIAISFAVGLYMNSPNRSCGFVVEDKDGKLVPLNPETKKIIGILARVHESVFIRTWNGEYRDVTGCFYDMGYGPRFAELLP